MFSLPLLVGLDSSGHVAFAYGTRPAPRHCCRVVKFFVFRSPDLFGGERHLQADLVIAILVGRVINVSTQVQARVTLHMTLHSVFPS